MAVLWPLTRIWRNTGICSGPGFSLESEGGISLVLCRWWLIPLVSRSSCGGRLLHGRVRCNPCGVAEEGWGEGMRVRLGHASLGEWLEISLRKGLARWCWMIP